MRTTYVLDLMLLLGLLRTTLASDLGADQRCADTELPGAVRHALDRIADVDVSCRFKPVVLAADFDGDGRKDHAVLVVQKASQKRGFLIVFATGRTALAGAGRPVPYGPGRYADLNFDDWEIYPRNRPVEGSNDQRPLKLRADALLVSYHESASGLFYWDGTQVRWYQQGD
jgi:hypothetical protein